MLELLLLNVSRSAHWWQLWSLYSGV